MSSLSHFHTINPLHVLLPARTEHQSQPKEFPLLYSWELSESQNTGRKHLSHGESRKPWKNRVRASGNLRSATSVVTVLLSLGTKEIVGLLWNHCDYSEKKPTSTRNPSDFKGISHNIPETVLTVFLSIFKSETVKRILIIAV